VEQSSPLPQFLHRQQLQEQQKFFKLIKKESLDRNRKTNLCTFFGRTAVNPFSTLLQRNITGFGSLFALSSSGTIGTRPSLGSLFHRRVNTMSVESLLADIADEKRILQEI
jgi:hypothetical protein